MFSPCVSCDSLSSGLSNAVTFLFHLPSQLWDSVLWPGRGTLAWKGVGLSAIFSHHSFFLRILSTLLWLIFKTVERYSKNIFLKIGTESCPQCDEHFFFCLYYRNCWAPVPTFQNHCSFRVHFSVIPPLFSLFWKGYGKKKCLENVIRSEANCY